MNMAKIATFYDHIRDMARQEHLFMVDALQRARELGMRTLREDGVRKVLAGLTSPEEVLNVTMGDAN